MPTNEAEAQSERILREFLAAQRHQRGGLLPLLLEIQEAVGFIPEKALPFIARSLGYSQPELLGVITDYRHLRLAPPANRSLHVCRGTPCHLTGSKQMLATLSRQLGIPVGGRSKDGSVQLDECACVGLCHAAPVAMFADTALPRISVEEAAGALSGEGFAFFSQRVSVHLGSIGPLLRNCAEGPTISLDAYVSGGGFSGLRRALEMGSEGVISLVEASGLRGRGGAGFPTGAKWRAVHQQRETSKYVICNADESEPGTFKDRFLLANNPFAILEGMAIAAYAVGAVEAYLFVRFEYKNEIDVLSRCIEEAEGCGFLGEGILGSSFSLKVRPFRSVGGYICGEETALIEAIEGRRGEPRLRPPYPTLRGLWGQPTLVNNVETLANIPLILGEGAEKSNCGGAEGGPRDELGASKGTKLFCVSGDVARPGLYEVPLGMPLRELLEMAGAGPRDRLGARRTTAVLLGGAAGRLVPVEQADRPLDFEQRAVGKGTLAPSNGTIIVLDDSRCVVDVCLNLMEFFARECCGLCLVGREGTAWALTLLRRGCAGEGSGQDLEALKDVAETLSVASRCGLGQTAANGILGALEHFPEEVESHFVNRICRAAVCERAGM